MAVHKTTPPRLQYQLCNLADVGRRRQADPDDEDTATELWMSTVGRDLHLSAIELLIIFGMRLPPANEASGIPTPSHL